jgi:hypothetical protein
MSKKLFIILSVLLVLSAVGLSNASLISKQPPSTYNIPDTPEAKEIMRTVEKAYDIEAEAAYTFDLKKFPTVFINDPRFPVDRATLDVVKDMTKNPSLESAGWLDYKIAYFSWRRDATLHSEAVYAKAKEENRELTNDEKKSLIDSKGRSAPARAQDSVRNQPLMFKSVNINDDIATVILDDGPRTVELTIVLVDKQWYIAGIKGISFHP